jgi:hypothetical protein
MSTPPRRRRPAPRSKSEGGSWLPTIAIGLGVVIAGLGIGALGGAFLQRGEQRPATDAQPVALATSTAAAPPPLGRAPVAIATFIARPSPTREATPEPTVEPTPEPTSAPTPTAPPATPTPRASARPEAAVRAGATPQPVVAVAPTRAASPRALVTTPEPTAEATSEVTPAAPATSAAASSYDEHASAVVRRYVEALIRGDEKTAYAALGGSGTLSEQEFLDPSARIVSIKVTRIDASNASVGCEIASAKGQYYATYHVSAATSGPYITEHDYIKV